MIAWLRPESRGLLRNVFTVEPIRFIGVTGTLMLLPGGVGISKSKPTKDGHVGSFDENRGKSDTSANQVADSGHLDCRRSGS